MNIVFVGTKMAPWSTTGGLGGFPLANGREWVPRDGLVDTRC
jgi:hypothetical protein